MWQQDGVCDLTDTSQEVVTPAATVTARLSVIEISVTDFTLKYAFSARIVDNSV